MSLKGYWIDDRETGRPFIDDERGRDHRADVGRLPVMLPPMMQPTAIYQMPMECSRTHQLSSRSSPTMIAGLPPGRATAAKEAARRTAGNDDHSRTAAASTGRLIGPSSDALARDP